MHLDIIAAFRHVTICSLLITPLTMPLATDKLMEKGKPGKTMTKVAARKNVGPKTEKILAGTIKQAPWEGPINNMRQILRIKRVPREGVLNGRA